MVQRCIVLFLIGATWALNAGAAVWYVDVDSTATSPDGKSWAKAFRNLQQGIDAASAQGGEVWVAEGVYGESRSSQPEGALVLRPSVDVYGGFAGTESASSQRNFNTHVTVIDGSRSRGSGLPAYHVVLGANSARLDGFTIRGGNANGGGTVDDPRRFGGGVFNHSVSPRLANLVFEGLDATAGGAGLYNSGGAPTVTACTFRNLDTPGKGAAVYNVSSSVTFEDCVFLLNEAAAGGAVHNNGSTPTYRNCLFSENSAQKGGAVCNVSSSASFRNCTFEDNSSTSDGGAVHNETASPSFIACAFTTNQAGTGAAANGGAIYNPGSASNLTNCTFLSNSAFTRGGAIYGTAAFSVMNCSFKGNRASSGGTLFNAGSAPKVTNSILWDGSPSEITNSGGTAVVTYSDVEGGYTGTGNINSNPSFVNTGGMPLRLKPGSPCINKGTASNAPSTDFAGNARPSGAGYDIGAFEGATCLLTTALSGPGTLSPAPGLYYYNQGALATLTATPSANCRFVGWSGGATGTQNPLALTMSADREVQANFIRQYKLTVQVQGTGTVTPGAGEHIYDSGAQVSLTVSAPAGWRFDHWEGDLTGSTTPGSITMSADRTVKAVFVRTFTLIVAVQGSGTTNPAAGTHTYTEGAVVSVSAAPRTGWRFDRWEGAATGSTTPVSITMSANRTLTAIFEEIPTFDLTIITNGSGTTSPAAGTRTYTEGTVVVITATPQSGWRFDHWEGAATGSNNSVSVTMTVDRTVTAFFEEIPTFSLTISTGGSGTTNPAAGVHSYEENSSVSVRAMPATNWAFQHWEGDVTGSTNPLPLTMTRDWSIKAVFVKIPLEVKSLSPTAGLSIGGTPLTLSVQSWTSNCGVYLGGQSCRILSTSGTGTTEVRVAAPAIVPGNYGVVVKDRVTQDEDAATATFACLGDPFDTRLAAFDSGIEIDDNNALVTTYARRFWRGAGGMPAIHYDDPRGLIVDIPSSAFPATATGAFLLARIAAQPGDLFNPVTPLPDYRLRSAVADLHVFVQEPAVGGGFQYSLLTAPIAGEMTFTSTLSPGPLDPLVAGGLDTGLDEVFAALPPAPPDFAELTTTHTIDAQDRAVFKLTTFGTVALFGDGPYQDINDDGIVDAADIQSVVNAAIGLDIGGHNADVDGDGKVNATDIQMVVNAFLGHW